jgi:MFS family permease
VSSYLRVLREKDFRYLFLGQAASMVGDRVVLVALALYITERTGSPTDLGVVLAAGALPFVTLVLFGGVWADRLPRHRIMIATDLIRAMLHCILAVLIATGAAQIWEIVVIEGLFGAAQAFFQPAFSGLMPQCVPEPLIQDARALSETVSNVAFMLGPAVATALVLGIGAWEAFAFDAATFVISALLLTRVRPRLRGEVVAAQSLIAELRAGFREVCARPWVWVTILSFTGVVLCAYSQWFALAPSIARHFYGSAGVFGLVESMAGGGAVVGALVAIRWRPALPLRDGLVLSLFWPALGGLFALGAPLPLVCCCALFTGFGFSLLIIWWETALAHHIPAHLLSRVSAWDWMGSLALLPVGFIAAGPLASVFGARTVLGVGSAIGFVLLVGSLLPRSTRQLGSGTAVGGRVVEASLR